MTKRDEFDHEMANFIDALLSHHVRKKGGVARVLNQFFLVSQDDIGADLCRIKEAKTRLETQLSTKMFDVCVERLKLDDDMQPVWLFLVMFKFALKHNWEPDSLTFVLTDQGYEVDGRSFKFREKKATVKVDDPHWDVLRKALGRHRSFPAFPAGPR